MSYIQKNLLEGEHAVYFGKLHWSVFIPAVFYLCIAVACAGVFIRGGDTAMIAYTFGSLFMLVSFVSFIRALIRKISTELAVTDKRVIFKEGLISRSTMELPHGRIESIREAQSIPGRILGYGDIILEGTGGGKQFMKQIARPTTFKKHAQSAAIDASQPATK